ncbi:phosphatase 2C-like domain-containing protein, partial [Ochromonadaceae sp. CCMP2298]
SQVFIAHVGDCRAVLCNDGVAVQLTTDHKANIKSEKARIEAAGGWVHNNRVNGALGVSRAFGDIQFKSFDEEPGHVISKPDFKHFVVERQFEFVIMACDGLWDVFDCQEAVNFVRKKLASTKSVERTAQELVAKAIKRGTQVYKCLLISLCHYTTVF